MIAYLILVHRFPNQVKRLLTAIYDPKNYYVIHVDKRSHADIQKDIHNFTAKFPNVSVMKSQNTIWGGYSLIDTELLGIQELLKMSTNWEFFINLSGQDFPLKSQKEIRAFLEKNRGREFIKIMEQRTFRTDTLYRIQNIVLEIGNRIIRTPFKRPYLRKTTPYIGNQWMILSRKFCEFVSDNPEVNRFKRFYRFTFIPDEGFFQTVLMNTSYQASIVNDDKRTIDWVPSGNIKLRPRNFTLKDERYLMHSNGLFARKFDESVDSKILSALENKIQPQYVFGHTKNQTIQ
jgi:hypothetical protein